jgi:glyoxylase-like metal-dependent hydrolase (beta-lactamase superfamily II)
VQIDGKDLIIDPGVESVEWVSKMVTNPIAILNTHGHFDHIWSNQALKQKYNIPIYTPKQDAFMLQKDPFGYGTPPSKADHEVESDEKLDIDGISVQYLHFPGHTPGCSAIEIGDALFSGDFIFQGSIGRVDFPYCDADLMKKSIAKFLKIPYDKKVYPGHGFATTIKKEQKTLPAWLDYI